MTPEAVAKYSRIHRRCGTSFLIVVIIVSIFVFSIIGGSSILWRVSSRVILFPLVIGVSYEFIRAAAASKTWGRICILPALSLQYLTTKEPTKDQLEIAIDALDLALRAEEIQETQTSQVV